MALARVFLVVNILICVFGQENDSPSPIRDTIHTIESEGYVAETHGLITTDGYLLELHRIPYKRYKTTGAYNRPVVLLMHGILRDSAAFIALGPKYSMAYNLADAGFDVWLGNARGTRNCRQHINFNPENVRDKPTFFNFSWEQIGYYDVANMVDYILIHTGNEKLNYIGHSQGATAFFVLNSMRPEYNDRFLTAHLLAATGYQNHFPNKLLRSLARFTNTIYSMTQRLSVVEIFPPLNKSRRNEDSSAGENWLHVFDCGSDELCRPSDICTGETRQKEICELMGIHEIMSDKIADNLYVDYLPGGASTKQIAHYGQNIQDKSFRRWNYGPMENFQKYGSSQPPAYNLSLVTARVTMHYTINDHLVHEDDILAMAADMPNASIRRVGRDSFLHVDFVAAGDVKELVTDYIIEEMLRLHDCNCTNNPSSEIDLESRFYFEDDFDASKTQLKTENVTQPQKHKPSSSSPVVLHFFIKMYLMFFICCLIFSNNNIRMYELTQ